MDKYKLEYEMKSRGITIERLCHDLKMSRSAFYRKCNGISEFTQSEIQNHSGLYWPGFSNGNFFYRKSVLKDTLS